MNRNGHRHSCAALLLLSCVASAHADPPEPVIVAYVFPQGKSIQPGEIAARKLTRINYAFANLSKGLMVEGDPADPQNLATLVALKRENPSLAVLISVGGWSWSGGFSTMALTPESRGRFIQSVVDFVQRDHLDGLDVDWEYPAMAGASKHFRPVDKQNYTLLLAELRGRFNREEKRLGRRLLLTIAAGAESDFLEHTEMAKVQQSVDAVNLMAYDYYEPGSQKITGNQSPLFSDPADPEKTSVDDSVRQFEAAGVPAAKLVVGVPFYGHLWGQVPDRNHGLFQPGKHVSGDFASFADISATMLDKGFTRYWDAAASAPSLYSAEKGIFVSYDDAESLALKCRYIASHRLAGIMIWDYEDDPRGILLDTIDRQLGPDASKTP